MSCDFFYGRGRDDNKCGVTKVKWENTVLGVYKQKFEEEKMALELKKEYFFWD